jgi:MSHA pilin protein MshA
MKNLKARGFTLIELVVVITILGILAAFAIPKFISLDQQARFATITGLGGSLEMANGGTATASVTMEGATVTMLNFYPDATATGIQLAVNTGSDFTPLVVAGAMQWTKVGAPATCIVTYTAAAANAAPVVVVAPLASC